MELNENQQDQIRDFWIKRFRMMTLTNCHIVNTYEPLTAMKNLKRLEDNAQSCVEQALDKLGISGKVNIRLIMLSGSYAMGIDHEGSDLNFVLEVESPLDVAELQTMLNDEKLSGNAMRISDIPVHIKLLRPCPAITKGKDLNRESLPYYLYSEMKRLWERQHQPLSGYVIDFLQHVSRSVDMAEPITGKNRKIDREIGEIVEELSAGKNIDNVQTMYLLSVYQAANMKLCCKIDHLEHRSEAENVKAILDENERLKTLIEKNDGIINEQSRMIQELRGIIDRYQMACLPPATSYVQ